MGVKIIEKNLGKTSVKGEMLIKNIGSLWSGDINKPILDADSIRIVDGKIDEVGNGLNTASENTVIDAMGLTIAPGLIDSHTHMAISGYNYYTGNTTWMEDAFNGGVTTMIDEGCVCEIWGRPTDGPGIRALSILLRKTMAAHRAGGGLKAHGGSVVLERGLTEDDFEAMAKEGVWLVAELGGGGLWKPEEIGPLCKIARKYGFKIAEHLGGQAIPGGASCAKDIFYEWHDALGEEGDVAVHVNGGPTAPPFEDMCELIDNTNKMMIETIFNGNVTAEKKTIKYLYEKEGLKRFLMGTDSPVGLSTNSPVAVLRVISRVSSLCEIPAEEVICGATGNAGRVWELNTGIIEKGREADIIALADPVGSSGKNAKEVIELGDFASICLTIVDGEIVSYRAGHTPNCIKCVKVDDKEMRFPQKFYAWTAGPSWNPYHPRETEPGYAGTLYDLGGLDKMLKRTDLKRNYNYP